MRRVGSVPTLRRAHRWRGAGRLGGGSIVSKDPNLAINNLHQIQPDASYIVRVLKAIRSFAAELDKIDKQGGMKMLKFKML